MRVNTEKVREYAMERGVDKPRIFPTSAKWEADGDPRSGFETIRSFIRDTVTGGRHLYLKIRSILNSADQILDHILEALNKVASPSCSQKGDFAPLHEKREEILEEIREKVAGMPVEEIFSSAITMKPGHMTSTLMQGSAVTLIGVALLLTTHVTLVDITGGILTGIGVLISAGVVTIKKGKVLRELVGGLETGRKQLEDRLAKLLSERSDLVQDEIRNCITPFLEDIALRENQVAELLSEGGDIHERAERLSTDLEKASG